MDQTCFEWIACEGAATEFDQGAAIRITGLSPVTFQNWANRELMAPFLQQPGFKARRKYSAHSLVVMAIANTLLDMNISAASSVMTAASIWMEALRLLSDTHRRRKVKFSELANAIAIVNAESKNRHNVSVQFEAGKIPFADLLNGAPHLVLAIGPIVERIAGSAMSTIAEASH